MEQAQTGSADRWKRELQIAEKELRKFWERGRKVVKRYMDDVDPTSIGISQVINVDKFNVFWSNVGVLRSALYAAPPKPLVKREFDDFMDDEARVAGVMMERLLRQGFAYPESDMHSAFMHVVEDRLVPGLGQVWLRYEPEIEEITVSEEVRDRKDRLVTEAVTVERIKNEYVVTDYVYWEDFLWSPARTWGEVWWVARRVWMNKKDFIARFGEDKAGAVTWSKKPQDKYGDRVTPEQYGQAQTEVYEIWDKKRKEVCWVSKSCDYYLDHQGDPLELDGFFPCPKPLLATHTTSNLVPKADYLMVQSQYRRLDNLAMRIGLLEDAIQASGVYDKANKEMAQLLSGNMNKMIPVENWAMFAEKGGLKGVMDWFPLEMVAQALDKLRQTFQDAKMELYELTGISDIMRGVTEARETLGAQKLKAQYSSVRLQYLQGEVAQFVQAALRIKAEIISKHFQPETIVRNSLIEYTPDGDLAAPATQVIKDEWASCYRIEVHADTLAIPDYNAEQQSRIEFITAMGQFLSQATPMLQLEPGAGPFLIQILQWGIASFRSAQAIEGVFDKAARALVQKLQQPPQPPPPDPAMVKAQAEIQVMQAKQKMEEQKAVKDIQTDQQKTMAEIQAGQMKTQAEINQMWAKTYAAVASTKAKTAAQIQVTRAKNSANLQRREKTNGS